MTTRKKFKLCMTILIIMMIVAGCGSIGKANKAETATETSVIASSDTTGESSEGPDVKSEAEEATYTYAIDQDNKDTYKKGSLVVTCDANEFLSHFDQGDLLKVEFDTGEVLQMPVCGSYDDVSPGELILKVNPDGEKFTLAINYGEFAVDQGFMEPAPDDSEFAYQKIESRFPTEVTLSLIEKGKYLDRIEIGKMVRLDSRDAYPEISDEDYANFRNVVCGSIAPDILYRSSSPIDDDIGRNSYSDSAMKEHNIVTVINMSDGEEDALKMAGYTGSYYSTCNVYYGKMTLSFGTEDFNQDIAKALKFLADSDGPFLIHCVYGKDRTGLLCAIIESLCNASMEEIQSDYAKTYECLYDVKDGIQASVSEKNMQIIKEIIVENLEYVYGTEITADNHMEKTIEYLLSIGLTEEDLELIQEKLSGDIEMSAAA